MTQHEHMSKIKPRGFERFTTTLYFEPEVLDTLHQLAEQERLSLAMVARTAIECAVARTDLQETLKTTRPYTRFTSRKAITN